MNTLRFPENKARDLESLAEKTNSRSETFPIDVVDRRSGREEVVGSATRFRVENDALVCDIEMPLDDDGDPSWRFRNT